MGKKNLQSSVTESRPLRESRLAVNMLRSAGVSVIYITDASIYEFLPRADMVIMGADTVCRWFCRKQNGNGYDCRISEGL